MPGQIGVTNTIDVTSVDEFAKKILSHGGMILVPKMAIQTEDISHNVWTRKETYLV
jgi:predicted enzyme related to lactoylglutathione lyase